VLIGLTIALAATTYASPTDTFGSDVRASSMAGDGVASPSASTAARANPAALGKARTPHLSFSYLHATGAFRQIPDVWWDTNRDGAVNSADSPLNVNTGMDNVDGFMLSMSKPIGKHIGIGLVGYLPVGRLLRLKTFEPAIPTYYQLDNHLQRYTLAVGAGVSLPKGLAIGAGIDLIATADFTMLTTIDAAFTQTDAKDFNANIDADVHELNLDVRPDAIAILGVTWDLVSLSDELEGISLGARYSGSGGLAIDADIDIQANINAQDIGKLDPFVFAALLDAGITLPDHYIPSTWAFGFRYSKPSVFSFQANAKWVDWRPMSISVAEIDNIDVNAPLADLDSDATSDLTLEFKPVWQINASGEVSLALFTPINDTLSPTIRFGIGLDPAPLVAQGDTTALLDGDTMIMATGIGIQLPQDLTGWNSDIQLDIAYQRRTIGSGALARETDTPIPGFPVEGSAIPIGGAINALNVGFSFAY
jgi:hypothetical protein